MTVTEKNEKNEISDSASMDSMHSLSINIRIICGQGRTEVLFKHHRASRKIIARDRVVVVLLGSISLSGPLRVRLGEAVTKADGDGHKET